MPRLTRRPLALCAVAAAIALEVTGCELAYPEVVVVNLIGEDVLVSDVSFNGCKWDQIIAFGEATSPGQCLPGADSVHFAMLDGHDYCTDQVEDGSVGGLCFCDEEDDFPDDPIDPGLVNEEPMWFHYKTIVVERVSYGSFHLFTLRAAGIEQDFSVPGPYGH